ncbi:MAG: hypothetical protein J1F63_02720 [Oscillospiraceae bacterium]|nr:hypothetical protein [Oscillospiraceae bacterium]
MKNKKTVALAITVIFFFSALSGALYILLTRLIYEDAARYIFLGTWLMAYAAASVVRLVSEKLFDTKVKLTTIYIDLIITLVTLGAFWVWG